jgi:alcohol dehydrogenase
MLNVRLPIPRLYTAQETYIGNASLAVVRLLGAAKIFVVISNSIYSDEILQTYIARSLGPVAIQYHCKKQGETSLSEAKEIAAKMVDFKPDWILAIGGGSVLDLAKLAWVLFENPGFMAPTVEPARSTFSVRGRAKLIAIPTTAGTGSEVSSASVYLNDANEKTFLVSHELIADIVILDTRLILKLPKHVIAASGLDALSHAIEGFVSLYKNRFLDIQAISATQVILKNLRLFFDDPTSEAAAESMLMASLQAGWVQNMKVPGIAHALAHQMGKYHIAHGLACGYFLSPSLLYNSQDSRVALRYNEFAAAVGVTNYAGLQQAIQALIHSFLADDTFAQAWNHCDQTWKQHHSTIIENALHDICAKANPVPLAPEKMQTLLINEQVSTCL